MLFAERLTTHLVTGMESLEEADSPSIPAALAGHDRITTSTLRTSTAQDGCAVKY